MIRQKILQQLLEWIECNLEHPISIEDIAQKSGYSRRNIQLLFRNFMHVPLGEYIRKRRLCRAAILVRLTAKSMLDIALSLHFDSQQSFSREFKKLFGCSPREYRHRDYWDLANIFLKWFTEFGHLNRGDMLTSEQHRCHNEKKKFQRRV